MSRTNKFKKKKMEIQSSREMEKLKMRTFETDAHANDWFLKMFHQNSINKWKNESWNINRYAHMWNNACFVGNERLMCFCFCFYGSYIGDTKWHFSMLLVPEPHTKDHWMNSQEPPTAIYWQKYHQFSKHHKMGWTFVFCLAKLQKLRRCPFLKILTTFCTLEFVQFA